MKRIILAAAIVCTNAHAADTILIDTYTKHSDECQSGIETCEPWKQPRRVSWQHDISESWSMDIGAGTNSHGTKSANIGALWQPIGREGIKAGLWAAFVTGYTRDQLRTRFVAAGAVLTASYRGAALQLVYAPEFGRSSISVLSLRTGHQF